MRFLTREAAAAYLAAMIDGEGCVSYRCTGARAAWSRRVEITNTEYDIIEAVVEAAGWLDITVSVKPRQGGSRDRYRPAWSVSIYGRENYERLLEVPLQSIRKREALREIVGTYLPRPPAAADLLALRARVTSNRDVARRLGVSHSTADRWLAAARTQACGLI